MSILKQLFDDYSGTLSYLLADSISREAAIIDPVAGQEFQVLGYLEKYGLTLRHILETHVHEDHLSAAPRLRATTGATLAMHSLSGVACCDRLLHGGDIINLGRQVIEVIHTPGHTPCSVTYNFGDRLFTGDTLGVGWVGSVSTVGSDASQMYDSVHETLYALPNEMLVYPGHEIDGYRVSCIGQEKLNNRDLALADTRANFVHKYGAPATPIHHRMSAKNRRCGQQPKHCH